MVKIPVLIDVAKAGSMSRAHMSREEARKLGQNAAQARWDAYYADHPDKLKERQEREARKRRKKKAQK
jgi:hypothetical protein